MTHYNLPSPTLSAALIVKNCSQRINSTLYSIKDIVDEIIIVDDYSTDSTYSFLSSHPLVTHVFQSRLISFADQRNFAISKCTGDYILIIDDDEILSSELCASIKHAVINRIKVSWFQCIRRNYNFHGFADEFLLRPILIPSSSLFTGSIHEYVPGSPAFLPGLLHHKTDTSIHSFITDIRDYSRKKALYWIQSRRSYSTPFLILRQFLVALYLFCQRYFGQRRFLDGWLALAYCIAWSSEEFFVLLWYLELKRNPPES